MLPLVAEIVDVPVPTLVARPVLLIVATLGVAEAHTALLSTCVELSLNVPVAVNCCVAPWAADGFAGVTAIDTSTAGVTVSSVEPVMLPLVAEIVDVPVPTLVAKPVLLIVATPRVAEAHTALLSTCVELSLNVPVAVNCCVAPLATDGSAGATVSTKFCAAFGVTPFCAVNVMANVPEAVGVPLSVPVPLPLSRKVTPAGKAPLSVMLGVGNPVVVTLNVPATPTWNVAAFTLVIAGA